MEEFSVYLEPTPLRFGISQHNTSMGPALGKLIILSTLNVHPRLVTKNSDRFIS